MAVNVRCGCGYFMQLPDNWAGKQGRCPQCGQVLSIPNLRATAQPPAVRDRADEPAEFADQVIDGGPGADQPPAEPGVAARNPAWIGAMLCGAAMFAVGLFLVLRGR